MEWPHVRKAVAFVALQWEIVDPRELRYLLQSPEEFAGDIAILQKRRKDLAEAPPISDARRLPSREYAQQLVQHNRAFWRHINQRIESGLENDRIPFLMAVLRETDQSYRVWDNVRDAKGEYIYIPVRRLCLLTLKTTLGEENYRDMVFPLPVPVWRFNDLHTPGGP